MSGKSPTFAASPINMPVMHRGFTRVTGRLNKHNHNQDFDDFASSNLSDGESDLNDPMKLQVPVSEIIMHMNKKKRA